MRCKGEGRGESEMQGRGEGRDEMQARNTVTNTQRCSTSVWSRLCLSEHPVGLGELLLSWRVTAPPAVGSQSERLPALLKRAMRTHSLFVGLCFCKLCARSGIHENKTQLFK